MRPSAVCSVDGHRAPFTVASVLTLLRNGQVNQWGHHKLWVLGAGGVFYLLCPCHQTCGPCPFVYEQVAFS